jgi:hypothetical protein
VVSVYGDPVSPIRAKTSLDLLDRDAARFNVIDRISNIRIFCKDERLHRLEDLAQRRMPQFGRINFSLDVAMQSVIMADKFHFYPVMHSASHASSQV